MLLKRVCKPEFGLKNGQRPFLVNRPDGAWIARYFCW